MRVMTRDDLKQRGVGFSGRHLQRLMAEGLFPQGFRLTPNGTRVVWAADEVDAWLAARADARTPRQAAPGIFAAPRTLGQPVRKPRRPLEEPAAPRRLPRRALED
jgi:predicted DNA-binding transcriptional regulator AlpA